jgi:hypothetical protein
LLLRVAVFGQRKDCKDEDDRAQQFRRPQGNGFPVGAHDVLTLSFVLSSVLTIGQ